MTDQTTSLREQYARAIRDAVRVRLGPNSLRLADEGRPVMLNYSEAEAAADAVLALQAAAAVRDAARQASTQQPDAEETQQCPAAEFEDYGQQCQKVVGHELHSFEQTAADCTCGSAGPAFVPAGHYRDCPQYAAVGQQDATQPTTDAVERVQAWIASDPVTARSEFGNGYREALRDITDVINGRRTSQPEPS
ncbi:hypothetical protein EAO71_27275 [Streptomyces sp. ms191]|uniref:hypothetical protein n=1 Tax=Streptomyces sp. ms191 TaxID=1827978 RepID=UPI0011CE376C|nr:hypothetical protein [Streptomyces sp. ms191]TXS21404.1 hypothetical protein EAO71_27275 [Streptomyces sp. ms191]